ALGAGDLGDAAARAERDQHPRHRDRSGTGGDRVFPRTARGRGEGERGLPGHAAPDRRRRRGRDRVGGDAPAAREHLGAGDDPDRAGLADHGASAALLLPQGFCAPPGFIDWGIRSTTYWCSPILFAPWTCSSAPKTRTRRTRSVCRPAALTASRKRSRRSPEVPVASETALSRSSLTAVVSASSSAFGCPSSSASISEGLAPPGVAFRSGSPCPDKSWSAAASSLASSAAAPGCISSSAVAASPGLSIWGSEVVPITASLCPAACSASPRAAAPVALSAPASVSTAEAFSLGFAVTPPETAAGGAMRVSSGGRLR